MTNLDALHRAILDDPADDFPRLLYADALDDRGGPGDAERAEFIRAQTSPSAPLFDLDVLRDHMDAWFPYFGGLHQSAWPHSCCEGHGFCSVGLRHAGDQTTCWCRGFVQEIQCTTADWKTHGPRLVREHPLQVVRLTDREPARMEPYRQAIPISPAYYRWWVVRHAGQAAQIPLWLAGDSDSLYQNFPTADEAHATLSTTCLLWAKSFKRLKLPKRLKASQWRSTT